MKRNEVIHQPSTVDPILEYTLPDAPKMGYMPNRFIYIPYELCVDFDQSASNLLLLADIVGHKTYYKSRDEIAHLLGVSATYVSRLLAELKNGGWIEEADRLMSRVVYIATKKTLKYYNKKNDNGELNDIICDIHRILGGKRKPLLTPNRQSKLRNRLKNFTKDQILTAATNLSHSKFHMGFNDQKTKYATVDFILKNDERVEKWLNEDPERARIEMINQMVA